MSTTDRPTNERETDSLKASSKPVGPDDQREGPALQFVLLYAPADTDWATLWEVYSQGLNPREVWPNAD